MKKLRVWFVEDNDESRELYVLGADARGLRSERSRSAARRRCKCSITAIPTSSSQTSERLP